MSSTKGGARSAGKRSQTAKRAPIAAVGPETTAEMLRGILKAAAIWEKLRSEKEIHEIEDRLYLPFKTYITTLLDAVRKHEAKIAIISGDALRQTVVDDVEALAALSIGQTIAIDEQDAQLSHAKNAKVFLGDEAALASRASLKEVLASWRRAHPKKRRRAENTPQPETKAELDAKRTSLAAALIPLVKKMSVRANRVEIDAAANSAIGLEGAPLDDVADALSTLLGLGLPLRSSVYNKNRLVKTSTPLLDWLTPTLAEEVALVLEAHGDSPRRARLPPVSGKLSDLPVLSRKPEHRGASDET